MYNTLEVIATRCCKNNANGLIAESMHLSTCISIMNLQCLPSGTLYS